MDDAGESSCRSYVIATWRKSISKQRRLRKTARTSSTILLKRQVLDKSTVTRQAPNVHLAI
jgi:hypothetical protein